MAIVKTRSSRKGTAVRFILLALPVLLFVGALGAAGYYYKQYEKLNKMTVEEFGKRENAAILREIGAVYKLPEGEEPSLMAAVSDKEALKKQYEFFNEAENGDYVLIYQKAGQAIIYRPAEKRIVKTGPINVQSSLRIVLKGDKTNREAIKKALTDRKIESTDGGEASATPGQTVVVDVSGKNKDSATELAKLVGGQVADLPSGEKAPENTDLLVLVAPATNATP